MLIERDMTEFSCSGELRARLDGASLPQQRASFDRVPQASLQMIEAERRPEPSFRPEFAVGIHRDWR